MTVSAEEKTIYSFYIPEDTMATTEAGMLSANGRTVEVTLNLYYTSDLIFQEVLRVYAVKDGIVTLLPNTGENSLKFAVRGEVPPTLLTGFNLILPKASSSSQDLPDSLKGATIIVLRNDIDIPFDYMDDQAQGLAVQLDRLTRAVNEAKRDSLLGLRLVPFVDEVGDNPTYGFVPQQPLVVPNDGEDVAGEATNIHHLVGYNTKEKRWEFHDISTEGSGDMRISFPQLREDVDTNTENIATNKDGVAANKTAIGEAGTGLTGALSAEVMDRKAADTAIDNKIEDEGGLRDILGKAITQLMTNTENIGTNTEEVTRLEDKSPADNAVISDLVRGDHLVLMEQLHGEKVSLTDRVLFSDSLVINWVDFSEASDGALSSKFYFTSKIRAIQLGATVIGNAPEEAPKRLEAIDLVRGAESAALIYIPVQGSTPSRIIFLAELSSLDLVLKMRRSGSSSESDIEHTGYQSDIGTLVLRREPTDPEQVPLSGNLIRSEDVGGYVFESGTIQEILDGGGQFRIVSRDSISEGEHHPRLSLYLSTRNVEVTNQKEFIKVAVGYLLDFIISATGGTGGGGGAGSIEEVQALFTDTLAVMQNRIATSNADKYLFSGEAIREAIKALAPVPVRGTKALLDAGVSNDIRSWTAIILKSWLDGRLPGGGTLNDIRDLVTDASQKTWTSQILNTWLRLRMDSGSTHAIFTMEVVGIVGNDGENLAAIKNANEIPRQFNLYVRVHGLAQLQSRDAVRFRVSMLGIPLGTHDGSGTAKTYNFRSSGGDFEDGLNIIPIQTDASSTNTPSLDNLRRNVARHITDNTLDQLVVDAEIITSIGSLNQYSAPQFHIHYNPNLVRGADLPDGVGGATGLVYDRLPVRGGSIVGQAENSFDGIVDDDTVFAFILEEGGQEYNLVVPRDRLNSSYKLWLADTHNPEADQSASRQAGQTIGARLQIVTVSGITTLTVDTSSNAVANNLLQAYSIKAKGERGEPGPAGAPGADGAAGADGRDGATPPNNKVIPTTITSSFRQTFISSTIVQALPGISLDNVLVVGRRYKILALFRTYVERADNFSFRYLNRAVNTPANTRANAGEALPDLYVRPGEPASAYNVSFTYIAFFTAVNTSLQAIIRPTITSGQSNSRIQFTTGGAFFVEEVDNTDIVTTFRS